MKEVITSSKNPEVKYLRKLYRARKRRKEDKFILEGSRFIEQALDSGCTLTGVFVTPDFTEEELLSRIKKQRVKITYLASSLLKKVADTVSPHGIIAHA